MATKPASMHGVTVFLVDGDESARERSCSMLVAAGLAVESHADAATFLRTFNHGTPGCVLVDLQVNSMGGLGLLSELRRQHIATPAIVTAANPPVHAIVDAMRQGAFDFLEKPLKQEMLLGALSHAIAHDLQIRRVQAMSADIRRRYSELTAREREVAELVAAGLPSRTIAAMLAVGEKTIEVYRSRINTKMQARNSADLVRLLHQLQDSVEGPASLRFKSVRFDANELATATASDGMGEEYFPDRRQRRQA